jgi:hypothetical protein
MVICWPCAFAGHDAAAPLPAGAAALPLADALVDAPPPPADALADAPPPVDALADAPPPPVDALGAAGLAPVLPAVLGDAAPLPVPPLPPPQAASVTLSSVNTLIEPHRCLNRTFIP